jgi:hypothetical protein
MKRFVWLGVACATFVAPHAFAQEWIPLQDGKSLAGWKANESPEAWVVEDGVFVTRGGPSHLFYVGQVGGHDFRNFEFSAEVMTAPGSNSGIYVHTRLQPGEHWPSAGYELQVINSNPPAEKMGGYIEYKMTGSIYAVRNTWLAPAKDGQWFDYRIRVVGKTIQTFVDGQLICEYAEPANPWRPDDKKGRLLASGTFALQAHDPGSVVKYRNMKVLILPDDAAPPAGLVPLADRELDELITWASDKNIPLIEIGSAPKAPADVELFWRDSRRHGMTRAYPELPDPPAAAPWIRVGNKPREPTSPDTLKWLKAEGQKILFVSNESVAVDEVGLRSRLRAIRDSGLGWKDFKVPGKP